MILLLLSTTGIAHEPARSTCIGCCGHLFWGPDSDLLVCSSEGDVEETALFCICSYSSRLLCAGVCFVLSFVLETWRNLFRIDLLCFSTVLIECCCFCPRAPFSWNTLELETAAESCTAFFFFRQLISVGVLLRCVAFLRPNAKTSTSTSKKIGENHGGAPSVCILLTSCILERRLIFPYVADQKKPARSRQGYPQWTVVPKNLTVYRNIGTTEGPPLGSRSVHDALA